MSGKKVRGGGLQEKSREKTQVDLEMDRHPRGKEKDNFSRGAKKATRSASFSQKEGTWTLGTDCLERK